MKQITFEIQNAKDVHLLLQLAERLNIRAVIKDSSNELTERQLTLMGMKLSEKSLAKDWEDEDDKYWNDLIKQK